MSEGQKYYVYKQPDGLPCVTTTGQDLELIGTASSLENAEKMVKLSLLIMLDKSKKMS